MLGDPFGGLPPQKSYWCAGVVGRGGGCKSSDVIQYLDISDLISNTVLYVTVNLQRFTDYCAGPPLQNTIIL